MSARGSRLRRPATAGVPAPSDRRFRRAERPARRRRIGQIAWRLIRIVTPMALIVLVTGWFGHVLLASRLLAVDRIVVHGTTRLSKGEVEVLLDGIRGRNLLRVDLEEYRSRVLDSPWVADVSLWRQLPSTIEVRVTERVPMAIARAADHLSLIDRTGVIIDDFGPQYRAFQLPIIDGLIDSPVSSKSMPDTGRVQLAARFVDAMAGVPELRRRLSQVDVSDSRNVKVLLEGDLAWLHLGDEAFADRLRSYLDIAAALQERFPEIDYVDLRFYPRIFVADGKGRREARR
jgi:cell division septal protein FtsQ